MCIPTRNRAGVLKLTLESLSRQTVAPEDIQVVVGDDGSTDGTLDVVRSMQAPFELIWTGVNGRGSAAARNAAARLARNAVLIFLDDDQIASPGLVAAHLEVHRRCGSVLVQGDYPLAANCDRRGATLLIERARQHTLGLVNPAGAGSFHLWGGNFSVSRETWARVGGFDHDLLRSQDLDFGLSVAALGVPIRAESRALSHHIHRVSSSQFRQQNFTAGQCLVKISRKHGLPVDSMLCGPVDRPVDRVLKQLWLRWPRLADAAGHGFSGVLWVADTLRLTKAQVLASRLVRRFYEMGGIAVEAASRVPPRALT